MEISSLICRLLYDIESDIQIYISVTYCPQELFKYEFGLVICRITRHEKMLISKKGVEVMKIDFFCNNSNNNNNSNGNVYSPTLCAVLSCCYSLEI